jgi:hypothetical protein
MTPPRFTCLSQPRKENKGRYGVNVRASRAHPHPRMVKLNIVRVRVNTVPAQYSSKAMPHDHGHIAQDCFFCAGTVLSRTRTIFLKQKKGQSGWSLIGRDQNLRVNCSQKPCIIALAMPAQ